MSIESNARQYGVYLLIALLVYGAGACSGSSASPTPTDPEVMETSTTTTTTPKRRIVKLEDGSYVEIGPGLESGFAHCCGDDKFRIEIECSDGLIRCYQKKGKRWKQTYGRHCKSALDSQCYQQTCPRVCDAYWEIGPERWHEVIPK